MLTFNEFKSKSDKELKELLTKASVFCPSKIKHSELIGYATSKLHGIEFIHEDEEIVDKKIIKIYRTPKNSPGTQCPDCKQNTLRNLKVKKPNKHAGYFRCGYCGLYQSPEEQKEIPKIPKPLTESKKEVKAS